MNGTVKITGGNPLKGEVTPIPNKNAIVAALPAAILTDETVTYHNVPRSTDVEIIFDVMRNLGAEIDDSDYDNIKITCKKVDSHKVPYELGSKWRASILLVGPLLARFGKAEIPMPGGCLLGERSIAAHTDVFRKVGVEIEFEGEMVKFTAPKKIEKDYSIWQTESSVTGTENLIMYAAGVDASFVSTNAACEPHVSQLLELVENMGAKVEGVHSNKLYIKGSASLGAADFTPLPDHVDICGTIVAAAITGGEIRMKGANHPHIIGVFMNWFPKFNVEIIEDGLDLIAKSDGNLFIDLQSGGFPMAGETLPKLKPEPWPGFPVDCLPPIVTLACKLKGDSLVQNWMYETGLDFVRELNKMGANIFYSDPQRVIVHGPITFKGGEVVTPAIIQACKAIFLAALADPVETTLHGANVLRRRYPDIFTTYQSLGADIEFVEDE